MSWVGQAPALELLERVGIERGPRARHRAGRALPRRASGMEPGDSAIVSLDLPEEAADRLARRAACAARAAAG